MDSFATYAYSCRICPLDFFLFLGLRTTKNSSRQMNPHWTIAEDIFLMKSIKANTVDYIIMVGRKRVSIVKNIKNKLSI